MFKTPGWIPHKAGREACHQAARNGVTANRATFGVPHRFGVHGSEHKMVGTRGSGLRARRLGPAGGTAQQAGLS
jgi:hypothetical protein